MSIDNVQVKTYDCGCQERTRKGYPVELRKCSMHERMGTNPKATSPQPTKKHTFPTWEDRWK